MNWFKKSEEKNKYLEKQLTDKQEAYLKLNSECIELKRKMSNFNNPLGQYYQGPNLSSEQSLYNKSIESAINNLKHDIQSIKSDKCLNTVNFFKAILRFFGVDYATSETILELVNKGEEQNLIMANNMLYGFIKDKVKKEIIEEINGNSKNS